MDTAQGTRDFEALARQYWNAWGEAMRGGATQGAPQAGLQGWQQAVDWWTRLAQGSRSEVNDVVDRFNAQAHSWFGLMQQVAAQFAGQPASAGDIAQAWKRALGAVGENPFPELFRSMRGQGQQGLDQWIEAASPFLESWRREGASWLGMPAFGFAREQQERWQALARAQLDYQQQTSAYNALMLKAAQRAFEVFEGKLEAHAEPGRQLHSARALFDLWIDAAEEAYAEIALSQAFREVYGRLVDAQMRVRAGIQRQVEDSTGAFGMPTRTEVDAAHRRIAQLEREVRRLRDALAQGAQGAGHGAGAATGTGARAQPRAAAAKAGGTQATTHVGEGALKVHGDPLSTGTGKAAKASPASGPATGRTGSARKGGNSTTSGKGKKR